jgi:hypothetical protein
MGGFNARIAAISVALFALALGPTEAVAEVPPSPVSTVQAVQQKVAEVAQPTLGELVPATPSVPSQASPGTDREASAPVAGGASVAPRPTAATGDRPAPHGRADAGAPARAERAPARELHRSGPGAGRDARPGRRPVARQSASGRRAAPAHASRPAPPTNETAPVRERAPGGAGTAAGPRAFAAPGGLLFTAALIVLFGASRPGCLRPLRLPARSLRRLAFVSPGVPPG